MRTLLSFLSMLALGLTIAVLFAFVATNVVAVHEPGGPGLPGRLDYLSLLLGLALGIAIATLGRFSWTELPRRVVAWLMMNEFKFYQVALVLVFLAVLVLY